MSRKLTPSQVANDEECNEPCMGSIHARCTCSCGGRNHGIKTIHSSPHVDWKPRAQGVGRPTIRQEARAGQMFMFDIAPGRRNDRHRADSAAAG